jgi:scyllo-inositol 2-dehydrogenase (NADP+)
VIRVGVVGLGKMGLSHMSIIRPHPEVELVAVCDSTGYLLDVLEKYTGVQTFSDYDAMIRNAALDAVIIATPTHMHAAMVRTALESGLHVFCEKPFVLDPAEGDLLAAMAESRGLVTQVGYHNRFVGSFQEVKRLLDAAAIGEIVGGLAEAYGPVVLKPAGYSWRSRLSTGGGCLYDYAAHPLDLMSWYLGAPVEVRGTVASIFSREIDDMVTATLNYERASVQLNVNWSDESQRKMTTRITLWGTEGRIFVDRQEVQVFLRENARPPTGYTTGWNVRYTTELMPAPYFFVRGEEYSGQLDAFVRRIQTGSVTGENDFRSATRTDRTIAAIRSDAARAPVLSGFDLLAPPPESAAQPSIARLARRVLDDLVQAGAEIMRRLLTGIGERLQRTDR